MSNAAPFPELAQSGFMGLMQSNMHIFRPLMEATDAIMRKEGELDPGQRELVAAYASKRSGCSFCHTSHAALADALGVVDSKAAIDSPSPKHSAMFALADAVMDRRVARSDIEEFVSAGFTETAAQEVIHVTSLFGFFNRLVSSYRFETTPEADAQTAQYLKRSYALPSGDN